MATKSRSGAATIAQQNRYSTKWLRNAMKSVGLSTQEVFKDISPNLYEATSSGVNTSKTIVNSIRKNRGGVGRVTDSLQSNKYVKFAKNAYKNALTDIKTGNFNNQQRMADNLFGDSGADDEFSFGDDGADTPSSVNYINAAPNNDAIIGLSNQISKQSETQIKTQKASMDAYIAVNAASMQQTGEVGGEIINQLTNVNNNLSALVQYQNNNMSKFIESAMAYMEKTGPSIEQMGNSGDKKIKAADVFNSKSGGLKASNYKNYVKQQFKELGKNSNAGFINSMLDEETLDMIASNPLGMASTTLVKYMMPKVLTTSIQSMETTFSNFMPTMLSKLADWGEEQGDDFLSKIKQTVGKTFGLKNDRTKNFNQAKINRGAIPFDGETKHAITEVITKELRDQTGYLEIIANHFMKGNKGAKAQVRSNAKIWDNNSMGYIQESNIDKNIAKELVDSITSTFEDSAFGKAMNKLIDGQKQGKARDEMQFTINELYTEIEKQGKYVSPADLIDLINSTGAGKNTKNIIRRYVQDLQAKDPNSYHNLNTARMQAQAASEQARQRIMDNPDTYHLWNSKFNEIGKDGNKADIDELVSQIMGYGANSKRNRYQKMQKIGASEGESNLGKGMLASFSSYASGIMNTIMNGGSIKSVLDQSNNLITDQAKIIGDHIQTTLFGTKVDTNNRKEGGIFSSVNNGFTDLISMMKWNITGKEYTDTKGVRHSEKEDTVLSNFRKIGDDVKEGLMWKLFGKKKDQSGKYVKDEDKVSILDKITGTFKKGFDGWTDAFFGLEGEKDPKKAREDARKNVIEGIKKGLPNAISGSAIGAGVGIFAGSSILGALIGGPLGGAALGAASGFLSKNEKFQSWLFGDLDKDGNRTGGFISKEVQDFTKKNKAALVGGATVGTISGAITGGGILGTIVGGPIAGALMGTATSIVLKSDMFKSFLFGDEEKGQKGLFKAVSDAFNAHHKSTNAEFANAGKTAGMGITGAAGGAISAAVLGKIGILGASLTPLGPVGGALFGLGLSIKAQSGNFKQWLFGEEGGLEVGGKKVKKQGVVGQIGNAINANLLRPMKTNVDYLFKDMRSTLKHNVLQPFSFLAEAVSGKVGEITTVIQDGVTNTMNGIGLAIKDGFMSAMGPAINGFTKVMNGAASMVWKSTKRMLSFPAKLMAVAVAKPVQAVKKHIIDPIRGIISTAGKMVFTGIGKVTGLALKAVGGIAKGIVSPFKALGGWAGKKISGATSGIRNKWKDHIDAKYEETFGPGGLLSRLGGSEGASLIDRIRMSRVDYAKDQAEIKANKRERNRHDKNARFIAKYTKNQYSEDTDEAREYLKQVNPAAYKKLIRGFSEGHGFKNVKDANGNIISQNNTSLTQEAEKARIDKEGQPVNGMTADQIAHSDPTKLDPMGRVNYYLQGIFNMMQGNNWDGRSHEEAAKDNESKKKDDATPDTSDENYTGNDAGGTSEDAEPDKGGEGLSYWESLRNYWRGDKEGTIKGVFGRNGNHGKLYDWAMKEKNDWKKTWNSTAGGKFINGVIARRRKAANDLNAAGIGPDQAFADGGDTQPGLSLVGENGPETILTGKDHIYKNGEAVPVNIVSANRNLFSKIAGGISSIGSKLRGKFLNTDNDRKEGANDKEGVISSENLMKKNKEGLAKAIDRAKTSEELRKEKSDEAAAKIDSPETSAIKEGNKESKKTFSLLDMNFGKKGLITLAIIAGIALVKKFFPKIADGISSIASSVLSFIGGSGKRTAEQAAFAYTNDALTNGETVGERAADNIQELKDGNILAIGSDGNSTNQTTARAGFLARTVKNFISSKHHLPKESKITKVEKGAANVIKGVGSGAKKAGLGLKNYLTNTKDLAKIVREEGDEFYGAGTTMEKLGAKVINSKPAQTIANTVTKSTEAIKNTKVAKGAAKGVESLKAKAAKNDGLLSKVCGYITDFGDNIAAKFAKETGENTAKKGASLFSKLKPSKIIECTKSHWDKIVEKIRTLLGGKVSAAAVSFGLSEVIFATIGAIEGVSGTAKLFHIDNDKVDAKMRTISGFFGAFAGTTIGGIVDIIAQLVYDVLGIDWLNSWATSLYNIWADKDDETKLADAQKDFENAYVDYQNDTIKKQYDAQVKAGIIDGNSVSLDQFTKGVHDGTYKADYKSFGDYNTEKHKSIGDHIVSGFSSVGKGIKNGVHDIFGYSTTQYTDSKGNTYIKNDDGLWDVKDKDGNELGSVSEDAIPKDAKKSKEHQQSKVTKALGNIGNSAVFDKVKSFFGNQKKNAIKSSSLSMKQDASIASKNSDSTKSLYEKIKKNGINGSFSGTTNKDSKDDKKTIQIFRPADEPTSYYKTNDNGKTFQLYDSDGSIIEGFDKTAEEMKQLRTQKLVTSDTLSVTEEENNKKKIAKTLTSINNLGNKILNKRLTQASSSLSKSLSSADNSGNTNKTTKASSGKGIFSNIVSGVGGFFSNLFGGHGGGYGSADTVNGSTYYSQNDPRWASKGYNIGSDNATMSEAGCGPTAMAMAASDATGRQITPMQMAALAKATGNRDSSGTNWNFINTATNAMGIGANQALNPSAAYIDDQLNAGNEVILSGTSNSGGSNPYTPAGHYVVATGKDSNGNVLINDPRGKGYSKKYNINDIAKSTGSAWSIRNGRRGIMRRGGRGQVVGATDIGSTVIKSSVSWLDVVKAVKAAIAAQAPGYSKSNYINVTVGDKTLSVRTDCSGFVCGCLKFYGAMSDSDNLCASNFTDSSNSTMKNSGFTSTSFSSWDNLNPGDIIAKSDHVEIFAYNENGKHYVYNCGSDSSVNTPDATSDSANYTTVWSPGIAGANAITSTDVSSSSGDATTDSTSTWDKLTSFVGGFFSEFGSRALSGALTGDWSKTDYSNLLSNNNDSSNTGTASDSEDAVATGNDTAKKGETITLPSNLGTQNSFMGWQTITSKTSNQYKLREQAGQNFDSNGYGKINGRYTVATTNTYGNVGDYIDINRSDGTTLKAVIADIKNQTDDGCNKWGHKNGNCVVEFVVDKDSWYKSDGNNGMVGYSTLNNTAPGNDKASVTSITNQGSFFSGGSGGFGNGKATISNPRRYKSVRPIRRNSSNKTRINYNDLMRLRSMNNNTTYGKAMSAKRYLAMNSSSTDDLLFNAVQLLAYIAGDASEANNKLSQLSSLREIAANSNKQNTQNIIIPNSASSKNGNTVIPSTHTETMKQTRSDIIAAQIAKGGY